MRGLLTAALGVGPCFAQFAGTWGVPFNHVVSRASAIQPNATDPGAPFGGIDVMNFLVTGGNFKWGWPEQVVPGPPNSSHSFKAVHMALIPKGPNRGKVLVWNDLPVLAKVPAFDPTLPATEWWAFQAYAIIDPNPASPQFQNFLLPFERCDPFAPGSHSTPAASDLFCSGHTWTRFGDLVVVGGTTFDYAQARFAGPLMTYVFNPALPTTAFPMSGFTAPLYGSGPAAPSGLWQRGPDMTDPRWYATATSTSRIARLSNSQYPLGREVVLVLGGSAFHPGANPTNSPTWNSYEAFVVNTGCVANSHGLSRDATGTVLNPVYTWTGPGTYSAGPNPQPLVDEDWLQEYPRCHWLPGHRAFVSGYAPRGAQLDHEIPGAPASWARAAAPYSFNWPHPRHDGTSVHFAKVGPFQGVVMRFCGADHEPPAAVSTNTAELSIGGGPWLPIAGLKKNGLAQTDRLHTNSVILPTGAVLALGGESLQGAVTMNQPQIYFAGDWWPDIANPVQSPRSYHSTSVLLPDGRVFIGGGDARFYDYEIYSPYYLNLPASQKPVNLTFQSPLPSFDPTYSAYELSHGSQYVIECDPFAAPNVAIEKAVLLTPGSVTHSSDMHQRFVELDVNGTDDPNQVKFVIPSEDVAPRGLYMLWLVTNTSAVSEAMWVVLQ